MLLFNSKSISNVIGSAINYLITGVIIKTLLNVGEKSNKKLKDVNCVCQFEGGESSNLIIFLFKQAEGKCGSMLVAFKG